MKETNMPRLGAIVRQIRMSRKLSLDDVSRLTGLSKSTLSKVENNKTSLTYDNLVRLSRGLQVAIDELFSTERSAQQSFAGRRTVGRKGEGRLIKTVNYGDSYLCADFTHKKLIPVLTYIKVRSLDEFGNFSKHPGEEFTYIVGGIVEFHCEGYDPVRLNVGDYVYFDSSTPHAYLSVGEGEAVCLTVMSAPDPEHF